MRRRERRGREAAKQRASLSELAEIRASALGHLKENDIQLTTKFLVRDKLFENEKSLVEKPDEVYLSTGVWFGVLLRVDGTTFCYLPLEQRHWETGPDSLDNVTGSRRWVWRRGVGALRRRTLPKVIRRRPAQEN